MPPAKPISIEELRHYFHLPINDVARQLGVCTTVLKRICRRHGITRWPHRKIKSLDKNIECLKQVIHVPASTGEESFVESQPDDSRLEEELRHLEMQRQHMIRNPNFSVNSKKLRLQVEISMGVTTQQKKPTKRKRKEEEEQEEDNDNAEDEQDKDQCSVTTPPLVVHPDPLWVPGSAFHAAPRRSTEVLPPFSMAPPFPTQTPPMFFVPVPVGPIYTLPYAGGPLALPVPPRAHLSASSANGAEGRSIPCESTRSLFFEDCRPKILNSIEKEKERRTPTAPPPPLHAPEAPTLRHFPTAPQPPAGHASQEDLGDADQ